MPGNPRIIQPDRELLLLSESLKEIGIGLLFSLGLYLNFRLLNWNTGTMFYTLIVCVILLLAFDLVRKQQEIMNLRYRILDDRIVQEGKSPGYIHLSSVSGTRIQRRMIDLLFPTADIMIEPDFRMTSIRNYEEVLEHIHKRIHSHRKRYKGR